MRVASTCFTASVPTYGGQSRSKSELTTEGENNAIIILGLKYPKSIARKTKPIVVKIISNVI